MIYMYRCRKTTFGMSVAMNENCFGASSGAAAYFSGFRQAAPQFVAVYGKELCISIGNLHCTLTSLTSPLSCNSDAWNHLLAKASIKASFEGSEMGQVRCTSSLNEIEKAGIFQESL
nr:unnamed protein product [Haemonchus contortus]